MNLLDNAIPFAFDEATQAAHVVIAGVATKKIYIWRLFLWSDGTVDVTIKDETGNLVGPLSFVAQSKLHLDLEGNPPQPWFVCHAGEDFIIDLGAAIQVSGAGLYSIV